MLKAPKFFKRYGWFGIAIFAAGFILFHIILFGGAGAFIAHSVGYNVPFLEHDHECEK